MARVICLKLCPPTSSVVPQFTVPLMGNTVMKAGGNLTLEGGCDGCELVGNLLAQLNPLLSSLGLPLCLLGCLASVVTVVKAIPDALGPPPDPSKIIQAIEKVVEQCKCVVGFALPPPVGQVCDFLKMIRDLLVMLSQIVTCITGMLNHLISLNIKAAIHLGSTVPSVVRAAQCLQAQVQQLTDILNGKLGAIGVISSILQPIVTLLSAVLPPEFATLMTELQTGFSVFSGSIPLGTPPEEFLTALETFSTTLQSVASGFATIVSVCP